MDGAALTLFLLRSVPCVSVYPALHPHTVAHTSAMTMPPAPIAAMLITIHTVLDSVSQAMAMAISLSRRAAQR
ncbi:MAG: hypothetical protein ACMG6H_15675 [Acidobacteriota bacterium]